MASGALSQKSMQFLSLICTLLFYACSSSEYTSGTERRRDTSEIERLRRTTDDQRSTSQNDLMKIFRLQRPTVGLAQMKSHEVPVITPIRVVNPQIHFQIFRCDARMPIQGILNEYDPDSEYLDTAESASRYFTINKFWNDIKARCQAVSQAHGQTEFVDLSAPSGDWSWFFRACLADPEQQQPLCSDVVTASQPLNDFQNRFSETERELLRLIDLKLNKIRSISSELPERARLLLSELEGCNLRDWNTATRLIMRSVILNIVGLGSSIMFEVFAPGEKAKQSWAEKFQAIWAPSEDAQNNGKIVTRLLMWLFTNKHDFKETCTPAENIRIDASTQVLLLKSLQTELAGHLDDAVRLGIPLPLEVE